jgi:hypothetical protein
VRFTNYDGTWNSVDLGGVDDVKIDLKLIFTPIKIGSAGNLKLDDRFEGLGDDAHISLIVREVTLARIKSLCPWEDGSGTVDLTPPVGTNLYQYAHQLVLHPRDKGVATTEDVEVFKAVPVQSFQLPRDGVGPDKWEVIFNVYPDRAKLAAGTPPYLDIKGT